MRPVCVALSFLTRLPLVPMEASKTDYAEAIRWFPLAGLLVGGAVAAAAALGVMRDPWAGALLALFAWVWITGALHLDGLGDIADAAGAVHGDKARLSAVLADPHIGSFGVVTIALQLIAKLVLLRLALEQGPVWLLVLLAGLARIGPLVGALLLPPLHEGLGTLFRDGANWGVVLAWLVVLVPPSIAFAPGLLIGLAVIPLWVWWLRGRIGGISGDGHGAGIELTETALLAAWVFIG